MSDEEVTTRERLRRLLDGDEIRAALYRYARGVDRCDYSLVRSAYHPDAYDDHGAYRGGVDGLIDWIARRHRHIEQSMHLLGQTHIDFLAEDVAVAETYDLSVQHCSAEAKETIEAWVGDVDLAAGSRLRLTMLARFVDRFERRAGEWRIARRVVVIESIDPVVLGPGQASSVSAGQVRGPSDPLYSLLTSPQPPPGSPELMRRT